MGLSYITTTNTGKIKKKLTLAQQRAKAEHEAWLRKRGLHSDQIQARKTNISIVEKTVYNSRRTIPTSDKVGNGFKKQENKYTGSLITGIATMHKSNSVPVINKNQVEEISRMRR